MATRKAFIKKGENILLPYTRGELVSDSQGEEAFHSYEFVASENRPGLFTPREKEIVRKTIIIPDDIPDTKIVQIQKLDEDYNIIDVYPITKAEAVKVSIDGSTTNLNIVLEKVLDLDDYPTQGSKRAVTSGGVWQHIDDTVGEIHRVVIKI